MRRLVGTLDAADYLAASPATVRRWVASGRLTPVRIDRRLRFDVQDLDLLIESSKGDDARLRIGDGLPARRGVVGPVLARGPVLSGIGQNWA